MLAYFARRIVGGIITVFLVGLVMYSLLMYLALNLAAKQGRTVSHIVFEIELEDSKGLLNPDVSWPMSYVAWLFDPSQTTETVFIPGSNSYEYERHVIGKGINIGIGEIRLVGSGVLTGDLGHSWSLFGQPVADVFGKELGEFLLLAVLMLPLSMSVVIVQRRRRLLIPGLPNYPQSRKLLGQYLHPMRMSGI